MNSNYIELLRSHDCDVTNQLLSRYFLVLLHKQQETDRQYLFFRAMLPGHEQ